MESKNIYLFTVAKSILLSTYILLVFSLGWSGREALADGRQAAGLGLMGAGFEAGAALRRPLAEAEKCLVQFPQDVVLFVLTQRQAGVVLRVHAADVDLRG